MVHFKRLLGVIAAGLIAAIAYPLPTDAATKARVAANYGKLPLIFEANRGQTDARVKFLSRGPGYTLYLTPGEAVLSLRGAGGKGHALRVKLLGTTAEPRMTGLDRLPGISNYFIGRDRSKWRTNIPHYAKVGYEGVYPGIDLVFYGANQRQLEYDFIVAPGADPARIKLAIEGAKRLEIAKSGDLIAHLAGGEVRFLKPVIYQEVNGKRQSIKGKYTLAEGTRVGFEIAAYDRTKPLVIDPVLEYSTYLGASSSGTIKDIAVDAAGSAFVIGDTRALDFPTTGGAFQEDHHGELEDGTVPEEVFLAKLDASGSDLLYATYLGGSLTDRGWDVAVDGLGRAYLTGSTTSDDFPITPDAFQPVCAVDSLGRCSGDVFVAVIDPQGNGVADLAFSSYLGGSGRESGFAIAVDVSGRAHVTGETTSLDFPGTTPASVQQFLSGGQDAFLAMIDPDSAELIYATYLGGAGSDQARDVAVDLAGRAYLGGYTIENPATAGFPTTPGAAQESCADPSMQCSHGFVAVVDPQVPGAAGLLYSTLLSGMAGGFVRGVAVAPNCLAPPCTIYVTGGKRSVDDPATEVNEALSDVFVTRISPGGSGAADIVYSTLFGGDNTSDEGMGIAVDSRGLVYVTGTTSPSGFLSSDFPTVNPIQADSGGRQDVFVSVIDPTPNVSVLDDPANDLLFSTYLGGEAQDEGRGIALLGPLPDGSVEVFVT
ncbi:MAG: SBBP repeat-containing protein, partial [Proteobacteria bacterium]|nr:SBBP repeat-containing protein [Pseudomonadota bacterium]